MFERVSQLPTICRIAMAFSGNLIPATIAGYQPFNNALESGTDFVMAYFGRATVTFEESNVLSAAGDSWKQTLTIQYPSTDSQRAVRMQQILKAKFIKILLSNNKQLVIGRNDFEQNTRPVIQVKTDHRLSQVTFLTVSVFATGYVPNPEGGLPSLIPIDLTEDT